MNIGARSLANLAHRAIGKGPHDRVCVVVDFPEGPDTELFMFNADDPRYTAYLCSGAKNVAGVYTKDASIKDISADIGEVIDVAKGKAGTRKKGRPRRVR